MDFITLQEEFENQIDDNVDTEKKKRWLNLGLYDIWNATDLWPFKKKSATLTFTNGLADFPSDFAKAGSLYVGTVPYSPIAYQDRNISGQSKTFYVYHGGNQIGVFPTTVTSGTLDYIKELTELSADSDEPPFDAMFHELIIIGAKKRYHTSERESSDRILAESDFNNGIAKMFDFYIGNLALDQDIRMSSVANSYNLDY